MAAINDIALAELAVSHANGELIASRLFGTVKSPRQSGKQVIYSNQHNLIIPAKSTARTAVVREDFTNTSAAYLIEGYHYAHFVPDLRDDEGQISEEEQAAIIAYNRLNLTLEKVALDLAKGVQTAAPTIAGDWANADAKSIRNDLVLAEQTIRDGGGGRPDCLVVSPKVAAALSMNLMATGGVPSYMPVTAIADLLGYEILIARATYDYVDVDESIKTATMWGDDDVLLCNRGLTSEGMTLPAVPSFGKLLRWNPDGGFDGFQVRKVRNDNDYTSTGVDVIGALFIQPMITMEAAGVLLDVSTPAGP